MMDGAAAKKNIQHPAVSTTQQYRFHKKESSQTTTDSKTTASFVVYVDVFVE